MAETTLEKAVCEKCGVDVRENTSFCYNCGNSFADAAAEANGAETLMMSDDARTALDDLAARFKADDDETADRIKLAAAERKKARVKPKRQKEEVWQAGDGRSGRAFFAISLVIFLIVAAVVFITLYWK